MLSQAPLIEDLERLFARGCEFGHQDTVVEMLWCACALRGEPANASNLLSTYLRSQRRESGVVEWSLRNTTSADPFWGFDSGASARRNQAKDIRTGFDSISGRE